MRKRRNKTVDSKVFRRTASKAKKINICCRIFTR